jgi:protein YIPF1/2
MAMEGADFVGVVPIALFFTLKWFGSESANLLECWCLYGYANIIWIPVAIISWSPISSKQPVGLFKLTAVLNYIFVAVGLAVSAIFLVRNLYPVLSATDVKTSKILLIVVVLLHTGLAIAIKVLFFAHGSPALKDGDPGVPHDKVNDPPPEEAPSLMALF